MEKQNERKRESQQSFPFYKRKLIIIFSLERSPREYWMTVVGHSWHFVRPNEVLA